MSRILAAPRKAQDAPRTSILDVLQGTLMAAFSLPQKNGLQADRVQLVIGGRWPTLPIPLSRSNSVPIPSPLPVWTSTAVYNVQHHQRPYSLIPCLYGVGG